MKTGKSGAAAQRPHDVRTPWLERFKVRSAETA
jgi:hypothetical protein